MSLRRAGSTLLVLLAVLVGAAGLYRAAVPQGPPSQAAQVKALTESLRCPTCQGLSIADSSSVLAAGARQIVQEQVRAGQTPAQVRAWFVDRYGPSVLLSPDPAGPGLLAWLLPVLLLPLAAALGWRRLRPADGPPLPPGTSPDDDADALRALAQFRSGELDPDASPAGEALREALVVRLAVDRDGLGEQERLRADQRLGQAARRYARRSSTPEHPGRARSGPARALPRRALTALTVVALLAGAGAALAVGVRERGARDLPTGDLPGGVAAAPGLAELEAATRQRPQDPQAWIALGRATEAATDYLAAVRAYDRALALRPGADDVALLRAGVLVKAGSPREALPVLTALARRQPDDPDVLLLLGFAQDKTGRPEADATLRRFLELAPSSPVAPVVREILARP